MKKILGLFLVSIAFSVNAQQAELEKTISKLVYKTVDFDEIPGIIIGVIDNDSTYVFSYGETEKGNGVQPNKNTIFEIGSVSKVFTATLIQMAVNEGLLTYDTSLGSQLDMKHLHFNDQAITIKDLTTHFSGLPKLPFNFGVKEKSADDPYANYQRKDLIDFLSEYRPIRAIGEKYVYSHAGYAILSLILEKLSDQSFFDLLKEKIIKPLALENTTIKLSPTQKKHLAQGYSHAGNLARLWTSDSFAGAIGLKSTMNDLIKFVRMNLEISNKDMGASIGYMHEKQAVTEIPKVDIGMAWHRIFTRKKFFDVIAHSGVTNGHRTHISFVKETGTGVIVMSNSEKNQGGIGTMVLQILNYNYKRKGRAR